ncbi:MAG TPA: DNA-binding response regulator [Deferribacteraceae bacterium]|nr:DNA-binding response regulator [Deferribacteraceae bacterium]
MIRIAICDDMPDDLQGLAALINQYMSINNLEAEVAEFSHPDYLLAAIEADSFHLYILDIVMPMVSGLELGKEIRRLDWEAQIIYATTEPQFALQAYAANPVSYLIKPIKREQLFDALAFAVSKSDLTDEQTFTVKTAGSLRIIKLSNIICCEYRNHAVILSLTNGDKVLSRTFRENFSEYCGLLLKDRHFLQSHTSFIINMRQIERFSKDSFTLLSGQTVPIAAKRYSAVRDAYMDYLAAKGKRR